MTEQSAIQSDGNGPIEPVDLGFAFRRIKLLRASRLLSSQKQSTAFSVNSIALRSACEATRL